MEIPIYANSLLPPPPSPWQPKSSLYFYVFDYFRYFSPWYPHELRQGEHIELFWNGGCWVWTLQPTIVSNCLFLLTSVLVFPRAELVDPREMKTAGFGDSESSRIASQKFHYVLFGMQVNAMTVTQTSKKNQIPQGKPPRPPLEMLLADLSHTASPRSEGRGRPQAALQPARLIKAHTFETHPLK